MRLHHSFEWDAAKAKANAEKHGVSFDDAAVVLLDVDGDRYHLEEYDDAHAMDEDRWITTASHPLDRGIVMRIVWTPHTDEDEDATRVISARMATRRERKDYEEEIAGR